MDSVGLCSLGSNPFRFFFLMVCFIHVPIHISILILHCPFYCLHVARLQLFYFLCILELYSYLSYSGNYALVVDYLIFQWDCLLNRSLNWTMYFLKLCFDEYKTSAISLLSIIKLFYLLNTLKHYLCKIDAINTLKQTRSNDATSRKLISNNSMYPQEHQTGEVVKMPTYHPNLSHHKSPQTSHPTSLPSLPWPSTTHPCLS